MSSPAPRHRHRSSAHRWAVGVLVASWALWAAGCAPGSAGSAAAMSSPSGAVPASPLPTPSGTWSPPPVGASPGPTSAAPLPTVSTSLTDRVSFDTSVAVSLTRIEATTVTARTPGEVSGPALRVGIEVVNSSHAPIDVGSAVVSVRASGGVLAVATTAGTPSPLRGTLAPGATASGTYVFMLDPASGRAVTVTVNYAAGEPVAVFTGRTS